MLPSIALQRGFEFLALFQEAVRRMLVDPTEDRLARRRRRCRPQTIAGRLDGRFDLAVDRRQRRLVEQALAFQPLTEAGDGVLGAPVLQLAVRSVPRRIVRGGVGTHAVGHGLDQVGTTALAGPLSGGTDRGKDAEDVVAVDADPGKTTTLRP